MDTLDQIRALRDAAEARLSTNADYIEMKILNRTLRDLLAAKSEGSSSQLGDILGRVLAEKSGTLSQADAAYAVLMRSDRPLTSQEMVPLVQREGAVLGGREPAVNLSSTMSRDNRFKTFRLAGRSCWWLTDRPTSVSQIVGFYGQQIPQNASEPSSEAVASDDEFRSSADERG